MKVTLPLPPTTNNSYGLVGRRRYMYKVAKDWMKEAIRKFKGYKGVNPVAITINYYLKFNRDVDGSHKIILDSMQKAGVMENDNSIVELHLYKWKAKENPRVEVDFYYQSVIN